MDNKVSGFFHTEWQQEKNSLTDLFEEAPPMEAAVMEDKENGEQM